MSLTSRHLLGLEGVPEADIVKLLDSAKSFKEVLDRPIKKVPTLQGKTILNLFFESSTRTRISFELAQRRLSADTVNFTASASSLSKGETFKDTARNIEAMKIDMVVVRHQSAGAPHFLSRIVDANVINAGDGRHEHPTQALLDMYTLREKLGKLEGLHVCIVGDILHSRVALSNIYGLKTMGARVSVCGPATMMPRGIDKLGVGVYHNLDDVLPSVDALNVLRIQLERQEGGLFPSIREYRNYFGVTRERLEKAGKPVTILHPGPINRDVELSADVADSEHSVILDQVLNGVAVRMAVLYLLSQTR
jgi:aspartate carbamoyltransferase catalytic subunit